MQYFSYDYSFEGMFIYYLYFDKKKKKRKRIKRIKVVSIPMVLILSNREFSSTNVDFPRKTVLELRVYKATRIYEMLSNQGSSSKNIYFRVKRHFHNLSKYLIYL